MATGWLAGQAARDFTATDERMLNHFDIEQSEEFKTTKYFLQLLGFAVISELPWYLHNGVDGTHNVLFTLALGVMALAAFETLKKDGILCGAVILSIAGFASWSGVDYEWRGILMMVVFYLLGNDSNPSFPSGRKALLFCAFPLVMHYGIIGALLACLVISSYDGTRGFIHGKVAKYGFYAFYPVHLLCLVGYIVLFP